MEARKRTIRERETRQVEARRKLSFNDNGDAEAGPEGRLQTGARRKPNARRSRREGGFRADTSLPGIESPVVHRPEGVGLPQEVKAARPEQSAEAQASGRCRRTGGRGASSGNQHEGQTERQARVGCDGGSKACQRAASERTRGGESRGAGERQARRLARRNGRRRRARAQRRGPEPEGGRRVERKRGAQALRGSPA
jgi:hypothetical protein